VHSKGFLGPIGDDLPSLIPLIFALLIFFTVFTSTFNIFDNRNDRFKDALSVVRLSDIFLGSSYITGYSHFSRLCDQAQSVSSLNWQAGLITLGVSPLEQKHIRGDFFQGIDIQELDSRYFIISDIESGVDQDPYLDTDFNEAFRCSNTEEQPSYFFQNTIVRFYPVALEINLLDVQGVNRFLVKPVLLVIVAWN
jgi:hypothetical protein